MPLTEAHLNVQRFVRHKLKEEGLKHSELTFRKLVRYIYGHDIIPYILRNLTQAEGLRMRRIFNLGPNDDDRVIDTYNYVVDRDHIRESDAFFLIMMNHIAMALWDKERFMDEYKGYFLETINDGYSLEGEFGY
jgi:hypothetical protein